MAPVTVHLGLLTLDLLIEGSRSLKDKRRVVHGLRDRIRSRFNVSFAEVGEVDRLQRAVIVVACAGSDRTIVERTLHEVLRTADARDGAAVSDWFIEWR